jgi:hypothetical protein
MRGSRPVFWGSAGFAVPLDLLIRFPVPRSLIAPIRADMIFGNDKAAHQTWGTPDCGQHGEAAGVVAEGLSVLCRIATNANSLKMIADKIYVDASQPATLRHSGRSVERPTLQEAVIAWRTLPDKDRHQATIQVLGGPLYTADEIDRLYHAPKPTNEKRRSWAR